jgi:aldose 1-epimerase
MPGHDTRPPSGTQHEIRHGDQVAVVTEAGATLRSYQAAGRAVVDGFAAWARPDGGRGQVLAPWPNRVADGRWSWEGAEQQLALTEVANHNAIHGLVRWATWTTAKTTSGTSTARQAITAAVGATACIAVSPSRLGCSRRATSEPTIIPAGTQAMRMP